MSSPDNLFHLCEFVKDKPHFSANLSRRHSLKRARESRLLVCYGNGKLIPETMETAIMPKQSGVIVMRGVFAVFFAGLLSAALPATPCWGSDRASADPTITLDVQNEPLRGVLEKISKTTRWQIKAPDKWMDKPITQTLNQVSMEEGLRFILRDAGVENLLLTYDESRKTITVYDTEIKPVQSANRPPAQGDIRPPVPPPSDQPDPLLSRPTREAGDRSSRGNTRMRNRRQSQTEEE